MKNLFKISFYIILATIAGSCSKEDEPKETAIVQEEVVAPPVPENVVSYTIKPVEGRPGGNGNYQAGEIIQFVINIIDAQSNRSFYIIKPEGQNQQKHQIIGTDYIFNEIQQGVNTSTSSLKIHTEFKSNYVFSIKILRPGTFTLKFNLQKTNSEGQNVGPVVSENLAFAAVSFFAYSEFGFIFRFGHANCYGTVEGRRYDRNFYFSVNCGDQATDKYLFDPNFTYTYETAYCAAGGASGGLDNGNKNKFAPSYAAGAGQCSIGQLGLINCNNHNGFIIDEIKIFIKPVNGNVFNTISYKYVPIVAEYDVL